MWNDRALGFFEQVAPNKKNKMSSNMGSVSDPKTNNNNNNNIKIKIIHLQNAI